jgi:SAM-dependent methyltransferase
MDNEGGFNLYRFTAEFYDPTYEVAFARTKREDIAFYVDCHREAGGATLEVACGTGRVLIPCARAGGAITGLDFSAAMLDVCRAKLAQEPEEVRERVTLVEGDMTDFDLGRTFGLITIPFRPFQHLLTVAAQRACLAGVRRHLAPGGRFVFDVFHPNPAYLTEPPDFGAARVDIPETPLPDGRTVSRASRITGFHRAAQYNDIEMFYDVTCPDGRRERLVQSFPMRYFYHYEVEHLLELCGFRVVELYGNFDRSPFRDDSPEMIFVAEKAGS